MKWRNRSVSSALSPVKTLRPVLRSTIDWWMCIAEPGWPWIGLAMKVAYISCLSAASRMVRLNMNTWSASTTGSPWRKLISSCPAPSSWISVSISRPWLSEK